MNDLAHALSEYGRFFQIMQKNQCPVNDLAHALSEQGTGLIMVEHMGVEPTTSYMRSKRSPN